MLAENSDVRIPTHARIDVSNRVVNGTGGGVFSINSRATNAGKHARFDEYGTPRFGWRLWENNPNGMPTTITRIPKIAEVLLHCCARDVPLHGST